MDFDKVVESLRMPFPPEDHEWLITARGASSVLMTPYLRKPAIIDRLNKAIGFGRYSIRVVEIQHHFSKERTVAYATAELCLNGHEACFSDTGANVHQEFDVALKGAVTDSIKRVAKLAGVGWYLDKYDLNLWIPVRETERGAKLPAYQPQMAFLGERPVATFEAIRLEFGRTTKGQPLSSLSAETRAQVYKFLKDRWEQIGTEAMTENELRVLAAIELYYPQEAK